MLPRNFTAVVSRNVPWAGAIATEPYEGGWAKEAVFFVRALALEGRKAPVEAKVQISADGMHWADEGSRFLLPGEVDGVAFARVAHFGNWLRIVAEIPGGLTYKAIVAIHLK